MEHLCKVFKALSDETRLKILIIISSRVICQKGISKYLQISDSAVSQHIKILKEANILNGYKDGYFVFYAVNHEIFGESISFMKHLGNEVKDAILDEKEAEIIKIRCSNTCKGNNKCCKKREE